MPNGANFDDHTKNDKTNPTPQRPLTDVQLAAARWLVAGYGSSAIAQRLGINHHTVARWKRDPRVVDVVAQLRARADAAVVAFSAQRQLVAAGGSPRSDGQGSRGTTSKIADRGLPPAATTATSGSGARPRAAQDTMEDRVIAQILRERRAR